MSGNQNFLSANQVSMKPISVDIIQYLKPLVGGWIGAGRAAECQEAMQCSRYALLIWFIYVNLGHYNIVLRHHEIIKEVVMVNFDVSIVTVQAPTSSITGTSVKFS